MKILITNATLLHGGAERVISILANDFVTKGHEVELLLYYDKPLWYSLDNRIKVTIDEKAIGKCGKIKHILWRRKYIKSSNADIVVSFLATFNMLNIVSLIGTKKKLIVADRNDPSRIPKNKVLRTLRNLLYRFADGVVLQSENNKNYFSKAIQKKSAIIYNPTITSDYKSSYIRNTPHKNEIVSVGRVIEQKNPRMLLDAFAKISNEFPEYNLKVLGEGDLRNEMREKAKKLGLEDKVSYIGAVSDVFENIQNSALYIMTSNYEGMPNALLEAMCIGLPVISTKVSGATDVIENGKNGVLIDCNDIDALADNIKELLSNSDLRTKYAKNAILLSQKLDVNSISDLWINFFKEVINQ